MATTSKPSFTNCWIIAGDGRSGACAAVATSWTRWRDSGANRSVSSATRFSITSYGTDDVNVGNKNERREGFFNSLLRAKSGAKLVRAYAGTRHRSVVDAV